MAAGRAKYASRALVWLFQVLAILFKRLVGIFGQKPEGQCCPELYIPTELENYSDLKNYEGNSALCWRRQRQSKEYKYIISRSSSLLSQTKTSRLKIMESLGKQIWCYCHVTIVFLQAGTYLSLSSFPFYCCCSSCFSSSGTAAILGTTEGRCSSFLLLDNSEPQHLNNTATLVLKGSSFGGERVLKLLQLIFRV